MMPQIRTTVRIDDDLMSELKKRAAKENVSLTRMLNRVLRDGLASEAKPSRPFRQRSFKMGQPRIELDKALLLAAELEDEEVLRKLSLTK